MTLRVTYGIVFVLQTYVYSGLTSTYFLTDVSVQLACKLNVLHRPPYSTYRGVGGKLRS